MDTQINETAIDHEVNEALLDLAAKGKATFHMSDWTSAVGGNRVRAFHTLKELRKDGRVARVADDAYLIV